MMEGLGEHRAESGIRCSVSVSSSHPVKSSSKKRLLEDQSVAVSETAGLSGFCPAGGTNETSPRAASNMLEDLALRGK